MDRGISRVALHTQSGRDVAIALYIREGAYNRVSIDESRAGECVDLCRFRGVPLT